jgi:plastocyanin
MRLLRWLTMGATGLALGCGGGGGDGPTPPPPPAATLDRVTVNPPTLSLNAGQSQVLAVQALTASGATGSGATFSYASLTPAVASVSDAGRVLAISAGTSEIRVTATSGSVTRTASSTVTVTGSLPTAVTVVAGAQTNDFTPRDVVVARGGVVTWSFPGLEHNVEFANTAGRPANIPTTGNTPSGIARTFNTAGNFQYSCSIHSGMAGSVLVP